MKKGNIITNQDWTPFLGGEVLPFGKEEFLL